MLIEMNEAYKNNKDFHTYVDKYCATHRTMPAAALKCATVQNVYIEYVRGVNQGGSNV